MMQAERRAHEERIDIARPVELLAVDGRDPNPGYTQNLSERGIRARFESSTEPGANVLVRLALEPDKDPVEHLAKVVWTAPDLYGEGTEVGLRLLKKGEEETPSATPESCETPTGPIPLGIGSAVEIESEGIGLEATVEAIGDLGDDGTVTLTLRITDDMLQMDSEDEDDLLDEERWRPTPFKDAYEKTARFMKPVIRFVAPAFVLLLRLLRKGTSWLWSKLPSGMTTKVESFFAKLALRKRARTVVHTTRNLITRLTTKIKPTAPSKQET